MKYKGVGWQRRVFTGRERHVWEGRIDYVRRTRGLLRR